MPPLRFLLVGDPVGQSRSPAIHRRALELAGLDGEYDLRRVERGGMAPVIAELRRGALDGVNVTMPLKGEAFRSCDRVTDEAERSGSVNILRRRDGEIEGHSTDTVAFRLTYEAGPPGAPLLVLGAGGSARAALAAWDGKAFVSARDPAKAELLGELVPWGQGVDGAIVVNATPLGMGGEMVPLTALESAALVVDLPYGLTATPSAAWARAQGRPLVDGIEFLALQAAESFLWWTGSVVDSASLVEAARNG